LELVVVIVILAILAAVALPRFLDMRRGAYKAIVATVAGQFQSAAQSYTVSNVAAPNLDFLITVSAGNCRLTFQRDSATRRFDYAPATGTVLNLLNP
jgi:type II secretory pathway pseudopilin PulG